MPKITSPMLQHFVLIAVVAFAIGEIGYVVLVHLQSCGPVAALPEASAYARAACPQLPTAMLDTAPGIVAMLISVFAIYSTLRYIHGLEVQAREQACPKPLTP